MRRKLGTLVPFEGAICVTAANLYRKGTKEFHGYQIAKHLAEDGDHRLLTAYGTLYRALGRLETMGLLASHWEDPHIPARENRPGRRLYSLTAAGHETASQVRKALAERAPRRTARRPQPA